jgi:hypothetical protein
MDWGGRFAGTGDPGRLSRDGLVTGATLTFPPRSISRARSTVLYLAALFRCTCKLLSDAYRPSLIVFAWSLRSANIHNRPPLPYLMFPPTGAYHYQTLTVTSFSLPRLFLPREPVGSSERTPPGTRRRWAAAGLHAHTYWPHSAHTTCFCMYPCSRQALSIRLQGGRRLRVERGGK